MFSLHVALPIGDCMAAAKRAAGELILWPGSAAERRQKRGDRGSLTAEEHPASCYGDEAPSDAEMCERVLASCPASRAGNPAVNPRRYSGERGAARLVLVAVLGASACCNNGRAGAYEPCRERQTVTFHAGLPAHMSRRLCPNSVGPFPPVF